MKPRYEFLEDIVAELKSGDIDVEVDGGRLQTISPSPLLFRFNSVIERCDYFSRLEDVILVAAYNELYSFLIRNYSQSARIVKANATLSENNEAFITIELYLHELYLHEPESNHPDQRCVE